MLISVDPGINGCGVAYFIRDKLVKALYVKSPADPKAHLGWRTFAMARAVLHSKIGPPGFDQLVLECPQIYRFKGKGDPNTSLIPLALIDGALMGLFGKEAVLYLPHAWKGSVDPDVCVGRIQARLAESEVEQVIPCAESLMHNVWDAVGIGLKYLGRFEHRRIYSK